MEELSKFYLTEEEKDGFIKALTPELILLRTKAAISQEELANIIGVSRQTYGAIERQHKKMSWNTYLSLIMFYDYNQKTHKTIRNIAAYPHQLIRRINEGAEPDVFELGMLFEGETKNILNTLDEKAIATIKTILMVEYSRCNKLSGEATVKFFEGMDILAKEPAESRIKTARAIKKIKGKSNL